MTPISFIDNETIITAEFLNELQEQLGYTISSASVNSAGHLILTLENAETVDAGAVVGPTGPAGPTGAQGPKGDKGDTGAAGATPVKGTDYFTDSDKAELLTLTKKQVPWATPQFYGAAGNGTTDDTSAFQSALSAQRTVFVPGGTYLLSGTLTIGDGCRMILSTDTVLKFTQTSGNCITMKMSACLTGNHAVVIVPYGFTGNVLYVATATSSSVTAVPPFIRWDPQWKTGRYVTDLSICKPNSNGFHYSDDGTCNGTAVYIEADGSGTSTFMWGLCFSGLRIAGAFSYGIRARMLSEGWAHEMRIDAFIDACEIGVSLEDCNNCYVSAIVQPRAAAITPPSGSAGYARHGIQLIRSRNTDLSGSRVWDWNAAHTLWTSAADCQYQHIAMVGNCSGTILNDFFYWEMPSYDIRSLIYTDTPANLEKINILQEPFTRWFRPSSDGTKPLFYNGHADKELLLKETYDSTFQTSSVATFTNRLAQATDASGAVYNGTGYKNGVQLATSDGNSESSYSTLTATGFIPCAAGDTIRCEDLSFASGDGTCRVYLFDSSKTRIMTVGRDNLRSNASYYQINDYAETTNGCSFKIVNTSTAYIRLNFFTSTLGTAPAISVNEPIGYSQQGFLADGVKVKAASVYGLDEAVRAILAAES